MTSKGNKGSLECTYGISVSYELKETASRLCNLSDLTEEHGIEQGIKLNIIQFVLKKMRKSCAVAQIAEALEETEEKIGRIMEVARKYAPEYDEKKILNEIMDLPRGQSKNPI